MKVNYIFPGCQFPTLKFWRILPVVQPFCIVQVGLEDRTSKSKLARGSQLTGRTWSLENGWMVQH